MTTKKFTTTNGDVFYLVKFAAAENTYISGMEFIHTAIVEFKNGAFNVSSIDYRPAETLRPGKTIKTAVKYSYFV